MGQIFEKASKNDYELEGMYPHFNYYKLYPGPAPHYIISRKKPSDPNVPYFQGKIKKETIIHPKSYCVQKTQ